MRKRTTENDSNRGLASAGKKEYLRQVDLFYSEIGKKGGKSPHEKRDYKQQMKQQKKK